MASVLVAGSLALTAAGPALVLAAASHSSK